MPSSKTVDEHHGRKRKRGERGCEKEVGRGRTGIYFGVGVVVEHFV